MLFLGWSSLISSLDTPPFSAPLANPLSLPVLCYVFPFLFFSARNFAHRAFVAFEIFAPRRLTTHASQPAWLLELSYRQVLLLQP
jgi:hypothetical protein